MKKTIKCVCGLAWLGVVLSASYSHAEDNLLIGGVQTGPDSSYAFIGGLLPVPGSQLGNGLVQSYRLEGLTYDYTRNNQAIEAEAWGIAAALAWQQSYTGGWSSVSAGALHRSTDLSPDVPGAGVRGEQTRLNVEFALDQTLTSSMHVNWLGAYTFGVESYWTRIRLPYRLANAMELGPEIVFQGDPDYDARQFGVAYGGLAIAGFQVGVHGGVRDTEGQDATGYIGLEFSRPF